MKRKKESKQVNKNKRGFIPIDSELHRLLKIEAASQKTSMKVLIEGCLADLLEVKND